MSTTAERVARIDAAIRCHRESYLIAYWNCRDGECAYHSDEVDRLLDLRIRVERHGHMTRFIPERKAAT